MLTFQDCIPIGTFIKPHGFNGTLHLHFEPEWKASVEQAEILITGTDGLPVPWFVEQDGIRLTSAHSAMVDLEWINDQASARNLCGCTVYILKAYHIPHIVVSEPEGWNGYLVQDENDHPIGRVIRTENYSGNLVMVIDTLTGEKMIPLHDDLILKTDRVLRLIRMALPEGLLEI